MNCSASFVKLRCLAASQPILAAACPSLKQVVSPIEAETRRAFRSIASQFVAIHSIPGGGSWNEKTKPGFLAALVTRYPDLKKQIYNDEGKLRSFVNVYLNDDDIRYLQKDATAVAAADTLSIVPSIAGGASGI